MVFRYPGDFRRADFTPTDLLFGYASALAAAVTALEEAWVARRGGHLTARAVLVDALRLDLHNFLRTAGRNP